MLYHYTDHTHPAPDLPRVDVLMIRQRAEEHAWVKQARQSIDLQTYPNLGHLEVSNEDHALSIGAAWNLAVRESEAELVLMMGDDDILHGTCVAQLVDEYRFARTQAPNVVHLTSFCTVLDDASGMMQALPVQHTGMFLRQYLLDNPFDEGLQRNVGQAQVQRIAQAGKESGQPLTMVVASTYPYIFRQHMFMACGRPITPNRR